MVLPDFLTSSYRRYKEDTNLFVTWLTKAARAAGYETPKEKTNPSKAQPAAPVITAPKLKGRARMLAKRAATESAKENGAPSQKTTTPEPPKPAARYSVGTVEIIRQAEAVAASTKQFQLPAPILQLVERAISARQRCTRWFRTVTQAAKDRSSDEKHEHFTNVLRTALSILKAEPFAPTADRDDKSAAQSGSQSNADKSAVEVLHNRFALLNVEEPPEIVDSEAATIQSTAKPTKVRAVVDDREIYEAILDLQEELVFMVYCFFEDMHHIQEYVMKIWQEYKDGKTDLVTATATTNAAIDMVKRIEDSIVQAAPNFFTQESYWTFMEVLYVDNAQQEGYSLDEHFTGTKHLEISSFDDFLYLPTARSAAAVHTLFKSKIAYPQPVPAARFAYVARPELLEQPKYKQMDQEHERLSQMLIDMYFDDWLQPMLEQAMDVGREYYRHRQDSITKAALSLKKSSDFNAWIVFACRILLDIQTIMGNDVDRAWKETQAACNKQFGIMNFERRGNALAFGGAGELWRTKDGHVPMQIFDLVQNTVQRNVMGMMKPSYLEERPNKPQFFAPDDLPEEYREQAHAQMRKRGIDPNARGDEQFQANLKKMDISNNWIGPSLDPYHIYNANPLRCGTILFDLRMLAEESGITFTNHHYSVLCMAYLYNALHQTKMMDLHWPELDRVIDLHMKTIFGSAPPTGCKEANSRLAIRCGYSATMTARNARASSFQNQKRSQQAMEKYELPHNPTLQIFRHEYKDNSIDRAFYQLESNMQQQQIETQPQRKEATSRQLSPTQFLQHMREHMPKVMADTSVDYITLTRTCNAIMRTLREELSRRLDIVPYQKAKDVSSEPGFLVMTLIILKEAGDLEIIQDAVLRAKDERIQGSPQLRVAKDVIEGYLAQRPAIQEDAGS